MASEIRVNKITHTAGVGTITTSADGVVIAGIVTATTFKGAVEGNITGNLSGGTINATSGTITGNLGVAGVLTYEDVTNVDSVGVITARSGINLTGGVINSAGNINCTSGRLQRGSSTVQDGDAIAGGLNINGTDMDASLIMSVFGNDGDFTRISGSKSRNASVGSHTIVQDNDVLLSLKGFGSDGTNFEEAAQIEMQVDGTPGNNVMPGRIVFKTTTTDGVAERLRITSTGIIDAPTQAGFYARMQNNKNNVMGGGASYYTVLFDTDSGSICYDQHNAYDTSTGLYTVPTGGDGHYMVSTAVCLSTDAYGRAGEAWFLVGSNRYFFDRKYFTSTSGTITGYYGTSIIKLTAGQTVGVQAFVSGGSTDVDVLGANATDQITWFTARKIA